MTAAVLRHDAFAPEPLPGMRSGFGLAVAAHVLLVLALAWSVNWKASEPEGVVAELWSAVPQIAAPRAAAPEPTPPVVEPRPTPPLPRREPAPAPPAPPREDAQIAVERAASAAKRRLELERSEKAELARQAETKRRDELRREQEDERVAQKKQRLAEEQAEKKKAVEQARRDEARQAAIREANLKKMMSQAGNGDDASTGTAARSSGPSAGYAGRIKARIKPNIVLTGAVDGNPTAEVEVRLAPDGTIVGRKVTRSSGSPVWDQTVLRAIDKTEVLPKDIGGRVPPLMVMTFRPTE